MNEYASRIIEVLREQIDSDAGATILSRIVSTMKEGDAESLASELEDMAAYPDYLNEREARDVVAKFENWDGSRGAHWRDSSALFSAAEASGVAYSVKGSYNCWAFFAVMNMVYSDEWGVLRKYIAPEDEARICAELAAARLTDRDRNFSARWYFGLD